MLWPHIARIIAGAGRDYNLRTIFSLQTKHCIAGVWNKNSHMHVFGTTILPISSCNDAWTMSRHQSRYPQAATILIRHSFLGRQEDHWQGPGICSHFEVVFINLMPCMVTTSSSLNEWGKIKIPTIKIFIHEQHSDLLCLWQLLATDWLWLQQLHHPLYGLRIDQV